MTSLTASADEAWAHFERDLLGLGWESGSDGSINGELSRPAPPRPQIVVSRSDGFPFAPPRVVLWDGSGARSWHQNADGSLCLYSPSDSGELPWLDAQLLVGRIEDWFASDVTGGAGDPPHLDLERYFTTTEGLVVYDDLPRLFGRTITLHLEGRRLSVHVGGPPRKGPVVTCRGWAGDLGELERPVRNWEEIERRHVAPAVCFRRRRARWRSYCSATPATASRVLWR